MPEVISQNNVPLKTGDVVSVTLTVARVYPEVDAVEVIREGTALEGMRCTSPDKRTIRFAVMSKDLKKPKEL